MGGVFPPSAVTGIAVGARSSPQRREQLRILKQQEELAKDKFKLKREINFNLVKNAYIKLEQG